MFVCVIYGWIKTVKKNNHKQFLFIQNQKHEIKIVEKFAANTKRDRCAHHKIRTWDRIWIDDRKIFKLHNEKHKHSLPSISYTTRTYREIKSARRYRSLTLFCSSINIMLFFFPEIEATIVSLQHKKTRHSMQTCVWKCLLIREGKHAISHKRVLCKHIKQIINSSQNKIVFFYTMNFKVVLSIRRLKYFENINIWWYSAFSFSGRGKKGKNTSSSNRTRHHHSSKQIYAGK